jgi:sugar phosphate isomerase/epimerase
VTAPGIPNEFTLSTSCFGTRLTAIEDQIFAAVAMGFRKIELGLSESPPTMDGLEESRKETGVAVHSLIAGCRDQRTTELQCTRLGSVDADQRERALNSVRRHARLGRTWGCNRVVVRGSKVEDADLAEEAAALRRRWQDPKEDREPLFVDVSRFVSRAQRGGQRQVEHLCRSLHTLMGEMPDISFAIEPGSLIDDLVGFEAMGWILDDLANHGLGYWHDVGRIHLRERMGLPSQEQWLDSYGSRMMGIHLQDAAEHEAEMPLGLGEVDFRLLKEFVPTEAERVLELNPRHGRAEVLASVQFLVDQGF